MNETTTSAANAKIARQMTDTLGLPKYEMPKMEMPAEFREITDKGVASARDTCAKAKVASEEAADLLKNTYATVAKATTDYNLKLIEIARTNTRAAFDYAHELMGVKSPSECIELSTAHARKQYDIVSAQNKELCALSQKVAT
jgi:phasin